MLKLIWLLTTLMHILHAQQQYTFIGDGIINLQDYCTLACKDKPYGFRIPDPTDCMSYYLCHGNMIFEQHCELGKKYDVASQNCIQGKCPPCNVTPPSTSPTPPFTPSTSPLPTTVDPDTPNCGLYEHGHRLPHNIHCRFFWQCVNGRAVRLFCQIGMWYDRDHIVCDLRENVKNCMANQD